MERHRIAAGKDVEKVKHVRHGFVKRHYHTLALCGAFLIFLFVAEQIYVQGKGPYPPRPAVPAQPAKNVVALVGGLPLSGQVICIDPGHGGYDGGARALDSGIWEKVINLSVAQRTAAQMEALGARVVLTRTADYALCDENPRGITKKRQDMERRVQIAKDEGATLLLSIHMNEFRDRSQSGPHVFYRKNREQGRLLAGIMQQALIDGLVPKKKRVAQSGDYFILTLDIPSVLIECGFISNAAEEKLLLDDSYQEKIAKAVAQGVVTYCQLASRQAQEENVAGSPPEERPN